MHQLDSSFEDTCPKCSEEAAHFDDTTYRIICPYCGFRSTWPNYDSYETWLEKQVVKNYKKSCEDRRKAKRLYDD